MKKIYLLLIACVLGVFSANAAYTYKVFGNMGSDDWYDIATLSDVDGTKYSGKVKVTANFNFGIRAMDGNDQKEWWSSNQGNTTVNLGSNGAKQNGSNWWFALGSGDYIFTLDTNAGTLTILPSSLYLVGDKVGGFSWNANNGVQLTKSGTTYTATNVKFEANTDGNTYFSFLTQSGDWNNKYAPSNDGNTLASTTSSNAMKLFSSGTNNAWYITGGGIYNITVSFANVSSPTFTITEVKDPSLTLNDPTYSNVTYNSATLGYTYTAKDFPSTPSVTVQYKQGAGGAYVTLGSFSGTTKTGTIDLTGLNADTQYTYYIKVSSGTYSAEKSVSFKTDPAPVVAMKVPEIIVDSSDEFSFGDETYHRFTFTISNIEDGATVYYTLDNTTPSASSLRYRNKPVQVAAGCTISAIAIKGSDSAMAEVQDVTDQQTINYAWESTDAKERMHRLRIYVDNKDYKGTSAVLNIEHIDNGGATSATDNPFSWAKYEDFDAYKEYKATHADAGYDIDEATDHVTTPNAEQAGFIDLADNHTTQHYARNFTPAFYRGYIHANDMPTNANDNSTKVRPYAVNDLEDWTTNENPAAGKVDPYATARVAYTTLVNPDDNLQTGVEEVITDEAIDNSDDANAPVIYYNLQGVRVENPANGIYIRVQGNKSEKVMLH